MLACPRGASRTPFIRLYCRSPPDFVTTVFGNAIWKSGTHLLARALEVLGVPRSDFGVAAHLVNGDGRAVRLLIRGPKPWSRVVDVGLELPAPVDLAWLRRQVRRQAGHQFGGHAAFSAELLELLEAEDVRPVHMVRDPRAVADSFARWIDAASGYYAYPAMVGKSHDERCLTVLEGYELPNGTKVDGLPTVLDRAMGWLERPGRVLVVRFEDLVGREGGGSQGRQLSSLGEILRWVGVEPEESSQRLATRIFGRSKTFSRGHVNGWRSRLAPRTVARFNELLGHRLQVWGYPDD